MLGMQQMALHYPDDVPVLLCWGDSSSTSGETLELPTPEEQEEEMSTIPDMPVGLGDDEMWGELD